MAVMPNSLKNKKKLKKNTTPYGELGILSPAGSAQIYAGSTAGGFGGQEEGKVKGLGSRCTP